MKIVSIIYPRNGVFLLLSLGFTSKYTHVRVGFNRGDTFVYL